MQTAKAQLVFSVYTSGNSPPALTILRVETYFLIEEWGQGVPLPPGGTFGRSVERGGELQLLRRNVSTRISLAGQGVMMTTQNGKYAKLQELSEKVQDAEYPTDSLGEDAAYEARLRNTAQYLQDQLKREEESLQEVRVHRNQFCM